MTYGKSYPPKNRKETGLGPIEIEIQDDNAIFKADPNMMALSFLTTHNPAMSNIDLPPHINLNTLKPIRGLKSDISGKPAIYYRTADGEFSLSPDELYRLAGLCLHPGEYMNLRTMYGIFHEIHDDFYDEKTGMAIQPRLESARSNTPTP